MNWSGVWELGLLFLYDGIQEKPNKKQTTECPLNSKKLDQKCCNAPTYFYISETSVH